MPSDWIRSLVLILLFHSLARSSPSPGPPSSATSGELLTRIQTLYQNQRWEAILELMPTSSTQSPELDYYRGMALARLQRWEEARQALEAGEKKLPTDKRFPLELAGVAFKTQHFPMAKRHLRRALKLDKQDAYAHEFLASLYFLEGNLEAAIKYWNGAGKPVVEEIKMSPQPRLRPELLDRAFALAPASLLKLEDLLTTQARLNLLEIYPNYRFELSPQQDQKFDLVFTPMERNGWGNSKLEALISVLKGVPYQSVYFDFFNLNQAALNSLSLLRWDAQKRRVSSAFSGPWRKDPRWRYRIYFDGRKENWDLSQSFQGPVPPTGDLRMRKESVGAEIVNVINGRWGWRTAVEVSHRQFQNILEVANPSSPFPQGMLLKYQLRMDYNLIRMPERRFAAHSFATWELARFFPPPHTTFTKIYGGLHAQWLPQPKGNDYATKIQFRAGLTDGQSPFDELFILGLERDNDLWMRGHIGTHDGKKGNAPLGRDYLLLNVEADKIIYQHAFFDVRLGPFLDSGKIYDEAERFGSKEWLWDVGAQIKIRMGGVNFIFSYGKDLQSGNNAFYSTISR